MNVTTLVNQSINQAIDRDTLDQINQSTYRSSDDPAERIPGIFVEPVEKVIKAILHHIMRGTIIEPWIKFVDDGLKAYHREKS